MSPRSLDSAGRSAIPRSKSCAPKLPQEGAAKQSAFCTAAGINHDLDQEHRELPSLHTFD
jgi:hypothetical protein